MNAPRTGTLGGDSTLHVDDSGSGVPVILLHSSGLSGRQWRRVASALVARGFRALVPDLVGHGKSAPWPAPTPFFFHADVEHLVALIESVGPAHVVGHSYGGFLALLVAVAAPSKIRSLALYEPVAFGTLDRAEDAQARRDLARVPLAWDDSPDAQEKWLTTFVEYWGGPGAWAALREEARAEFRRVGWVLYQGVASLAVDATPASAYGAFRFPVLLMTGEESPAAIRQVIRRLGESIANARTIRVAGAGHMGPLTHDLVGETIVDWIAALPSDEGAKLET